MSATKTQGSMFGSRSRPICGRSHWRGAATLRGRPLRGPASWSCAVRHKTAAPCRVGSSCLTSPRYLDQPPVSHVRTSEGWTRPPGSPNRPPTGGWSRSLRDLTRTPHLLHHRRIDSLAGRSVRTCRDRGGVSYAAKPAYGTKEPRRVTLRWRRPTRTRMRSEGRGPGHATAR